MISGSLMPRLLKLYQTPLTFLIAIQCALELQINPVLTVKSDDYVMVLIDTMLKLNFERASILIENVTL